MTIFNLNKIEFFIEVGSITFILFIIINRFSIIILLLVSYSSIPGTVIVLVPHWGLSEGK
jgi:hypothetical protein